MANDAAPAAGRGSTLMVVGLVTLVLAAVVFGIFHWLESVKLRREAAAPVAGDGTQPDDPETVEALPRLALVPENPMLNALNAKYASMESGASTGAVTESALPEEEGRLSAAAQ